MHNTAPLYFSFCIKTDKSKKIKKNLDFSRAFLYTNNCCDIDSVEARGCRWETAEEVTEETEETESAEPETVEEIEEFEETIEEPEEEPEPEPSEPIELAMPVYTAEELLQKAHAAGDDPKVIEDPATGITILDYSDIL